MRNTSDCPITQLKFIKSEWTQNYQESPLEEHLGNLYETIPWNGRVRLAFSKKEDQRPITSFKIDQEACMVSGDLAFNYL